MRPYTSLLLFLLLQILQTGYATGDSIAYLTPKDTIFLSIGGFNEKILHHSIEKKQTLFSLAKFYGLTLADIYAYNPQLKRKSLEIGDQIRIPIPNRSIKRYKDNGFRSRDYAPVYYVIRKGDTMYRISKHFFRMPIEEIMMRNQLEDITLKTGQLLHVGWMSVYGISDTLRQIVGGPLTQKNNALKQIYQRNSMQKREREHQGVAFWQKNNKDDSDFYALHRTAPINSIIAVKNPMKNRTVYTKVIGRIPDAAYNSDVVVVLSPLAAKYLGARDPRFFVKVKYLR